MRPTLLLRIAALRVVRCLLVGGLALASTEARATASHSIVGRGLETQVSAHGVTLSLLVPERAYPRNSLVRVTVRVQNGFEGALAGITHTCRSDDPVVEVLDRSGALYPPPIPLPARLDHALCSSAPPPPLKRGATAQERYYVILRGDRLRARTTIGLPSGTGSVQTVSLATPPLSLHLTHSRLVHLSLQTSPAVRATVRLSGRGQPRRVVYTDWYACPLGEGPILGGQTFVYREGGPVPGGGTAVGPSIEGRLSNWTVVRGSRLAPGCAHPTQWHLVAGLPGYTVAALSYMKPGLSLPDI